jgi:hypothetical protein
LRKGNFQNIKDLAGEFILPVFLILLWAAGARGYFRAEAAGLKKVPELLTLDYGQRKFSYDGPIQILAHRAILIIPEKSVIYFYNPAIDEQAASYFYLKTRYALYPRKVIDEQKKFDVGAMMNSDYVMFYIPADTGVAEVPALERLPFLDKVFAYGDQEGYMAIYRVSRQL